MKKSIFLFLVFASLSVVSNAQEFITVTQRCPQCWGYGALSTYYGPVTCPSCAGHGAIQMTYRNPYYNSNNVSFRGETSDGYIYKGTITLRRVLSGGRDKFDFYRKGGIGYAKYRGLFYRLDGLHVTINGIQYYT